MALEPVAIADLAVGMYVAKLDRPWLETPFLFQGFTIKTPAEIAEISRYCKHVYIEKNSPKSPDAARAGQLNPAKRRRQGAFRRLLSLLTQSPKAETIEREPTPGTFYKNVVSAKAEMPVAAEVYQHSSGALADMMEQVRSGGKLDVKLLQSAVTPMLESVMRNKDAMTWLSRIKQADDYTYGHSVSCAIYAIAFGRHLGLPKDDLQTLGLGGMLLDVGKTKIPKELLCKTATLSAPEMKMMRDHVHFGEEILRATQGVDERVIAMVRSHHERYDGSGYPDGLKGPDISVFARIGGIVDYYDALITPRVYAPPISAFDAMSELHRGANRLFQSEMVEQFIQTVGVFPNGALVELSTAEVAVVVEQNHVRRLRPKLVLILDAERKPLAEPKLIDLHEHPAEIGERGAIWIERGLEAGAYGIDPARYYL